MGNYLSKTIYLIMNCPVSPNSMGGGDRILIENAKVWKKEGFSLTLFGCDEAVGMCRLNQLPAELIAISNFSAKKFGMVPAYLLRICKSLFSNLPVADGIIYSASDFLPDTLPAFKAKIFNHRLRWVVGFYLRARNPFLKEVPRNFRNIMFFLQQQLSLIFMKMAKVDGIFVLSTGDVDYLTAKGFSRNKILLTSGGVDLELIKSLGEGAKEFDAIFVGKFQDQKGLPELVEIWKQVIRNKPSSRLAIVGWGINHWVDFVRKTVEENGWEKNVFLLGFLDGAEKFLVLKKGKIFVFPSTYESWGVVTIEAMAAGLPVVAFDLPSVKRNLTQGALFVSLGDISGFADSVLRLLKDDNFYAAKSREAEELAKKYDWATIGLITFNFLKCLG